MYITVKEAAEKWSSLMIIMNKSKLCYIFFPVFSEIRDFPHRFLPAHRFSENVDAAGSGNPIVSLALRLY